ncbi:MAG: Uma2 family endonuclease [Xenococcaceae cyanobacterium MO_234.B1]|nr:Uma2 family endonuclease [Xenococcaceae cyanobacterium MO_234.B1]
MTYTIDLKALADPISDRQFQQLCVQNPELKFETNAKGELIVMSPTGSETGERNADLVIQLGIWNRKYKLGKVFDSSTGFKLPNGAKRSPDVSWIANIRWNALTKEQKRGFAPIAPDFVIECLGARSQSEETSEGSHRLMSPTDNLLDVQQKMEEYMSCGVKLGWLINPDELQVEIYRLGQEKEVLNNPSNLSGEDILPNLIVDLSDIFD